MKILGISGGTKNGANDCMCKEALLAAKEQGDWRLNLYLFDGVLRSNTVPAVSMCYEPVFRQRQHVCIKRRLPMVIR